MRSRSVVTSSRSSSFDGRHETEEDLNPAALAVGDPVHVPARINPSTSTSRSRRGDVYSRRPREDIRDGDVYIEAERTPEERHVLDQAGVVERGAPKDAHLLLGTMCLPARR
jgi:hypothetical protein